MIVDPIQALVKTTTTGTTPTATPLPTILPSKEFQDATDTGERTLW